MKINNSDKMVKLIQKVLTTRTKVRIGESLKITVKTDPDIQEQIHVSINGTLGNEQIMQFSGLARTRKVLITASTASKLFDFKIIEVELLEPSDCNRLPLISMGINYEQENCVVLKIVNENEINAKNCFFEWNLGENSKGEPIKIYTQTPYSLFNYEKYLDRDKTYQTFHLKLVIHNRDSESKFFVEKSFTVWNLYAVEKARGILKPLIKYNFHLLHDEKMLKGGCYITNLENESLVFKQKQIEFLHNDPEIVSIPEKPEYVRNLIIKPLQTRYIDCSIPFKSYPKDCFGYAIHFSGITESGFKVFASAYYEFQTNFKNSRRIKDKHLRIALNALKNSTCKRNNSTFSLDELEKSLQNNRTYKQKEQISSILTTLKNQDTNLRKMNELSHDINNSFGQKELGQECIPDEEPPSVDMACQLTEDWDWIYIPAKIINARKGDILLSPSGNGPIGGLLKQVSPPQLYSHSGLMIQNFYKLRHSTGSTEWLKDALVGSFITGDKGSEGLDPEKLKYFWPGTIDQTIDEAFNGSNFNDPDNLKGDDGKIKEYELKTFDNFPELNGNSEIIYPIVVKPEPLIEADNPEVRITLHEVAEEGKKIKGHYRFYCYTEANISLKSFSDSYLAPDKGTGWWASNTLPTVCSSFIWSAIKAVQDQHLHLEGKDFFTKPSEIEPKDIGAEVDFKTIDGLYYYTESERFAASLWLYNYFYDETYRTIHEKIKEISDLGGWINSIADWIFNGLSDASDDMANQVCNTFGFDWSGEDESGNHSKDSDRWKNPGDGRAVSPHNIKSYWDEPKMINDNLIGLYGYSENLIYRPARIEWRRISRWIKVETSGIVKGNVLYRGAAIAGAIVKAAGKDIMTNRVGRFELTIPSGNFLVEAGKLINGLFMEGSSEITLAAGATIDITIELKEPPDWFREVMISGTMYLKDEENWPSDDEYATRYNLFPAFRIQPLSTHAEGSWIEKMGGEVRAEISLKIDWVMNDSSVNVWCNVKLFEGTSEETGDLDGEKTEVHNIPKDTTQEIRIFVRNDDEDDDDHIDLSLIVSNNRQP